MAFRPFFVNHNLGGPQEGSSFDHLMDRVAGNVGNSYITHALRSLLGLEEREVKGIGNIWVSGELLTDHLVAEVNTEYTNMVVVMQDQIRERQSYYDEIDYDKIASFLGKIRIPFLVVSLGHNSFGYGEYDKDLHLKLDRGLIHLLHVLSDRAVSLCVRGAFTASILDKLGIHNVSNVGCPSYFAPGQYRKSIVKPIYCNDLKLGLTGALNSISDFPRSTSIFQCQAETVFIKMCAYPNELTVEDLQGLMGNADFEHLQVIKLILSGRSFFPKNIQAWESFLERLDFVVGSRMHGAIVALNQGVPAAVTNGDSRAREMCELFKIPFFPGRNDVRNIFEEADYAQLNAAYTDLYQSFESALIANLPGWSPRRRLLPSLGRWSRAWWEGSKDR